MDDNASGAMDSATETTGAPPARPVRLLALACDYDGTLAHHGAVDDRTIAALERVVAAGRHLLLVTGRELEDLQRVFTRLDLFERVVAENGAVLYQPATSETTLLTEPASQRLAQVLRDRDVSPLSVGHAIVATWEPNEAAVLAAIHELGLELQVIFNKGAVMVLPSGVNKATGLAAALESMKLSARNTIGVGDAENDHAFLMLCEVAVAVANALPSLKEAADFVTTTDHGEGVVELIDEWLRDDFAGRASGLMRHRLTLGLLPDGRELTLDREAAVVLVAGTSGSGKSTVAHGMLERLHASGHSFCVVDPEGDYDGLSDAVPVGSDEHAVHVDEAMELLERQQNAVLNLLGLVLDDRPAFFRSLWPRVLELRRRTGQPHWLVLDEAHHLLREPSHPGREEAAEPLDRVMMITVHPNLIPSGVLARVDTMIAVGPEAVSTMREFASAARLTLTLPSDGTSLEQGTVLVWTRADTAAPMTVVLPPSRVEHRRHVRKYAQGELPEDRNFFFRGPEGKLNLRAQNLLMFMQIADGVDDDTWMHHLRRGDYSRWFADAIKDDDLAEAARAIETMPQAQSVRTRLLMRQAIERLYTLPS
jgi:hydroxymethylpyrimidine pyrophosphatase-like HAD family hydrolase